MMNFFWNPFSFELPFHREPLGTGWERFKSYHGQRQVDGSCAVWVEVGVRLPDTSASVILVERSSLPPGQELRECGPIRFAWGYESPGAAQLALALLTDALGDLELAQVRCHDFKSAVVANWGEHWSISQADLRNFAMRKE